MKTHLVWLAILGLGLASTAALFHTRQQRARAELEQAHAAALQALIAERDRLAGELDRPRPDSAPVAPAATPVVVTSTRSPADVLKELQELRPGQGGKARDARFRIVHQLESLVDIGPAAIPEIRAFLERMEDVDYGSAESRTSDENRNRNAAVAAWQGRPRASLDFDFPPSLRLGLVDVLKRIGGADAEQALADMLSRTGRGVEVAYVARALDEMTPALHRPAAIAAAHELLLDPPVIERPNRLDDNSRTYLLNLLASFGDTSFAQHAQGMLIGSDGRIDRTVLDYLNGALKEQAMGAIFQAYSDPRITNQWEKASLVGTAFNYVGPNQDANQMFNDVLSNKTLPTPLKAMAIGALSGTERGAIRIETPTDPQAIQARITVLEATKAGLTDPTLVRATDRTIENLSSLRDGKPTKEFNFDIRQWLRPEAGGTTPAPTTGGQ